MRRTASRLIPWDHMMKLRAHPVAPLCMTPSHKPGSGMALRPKTLFADVRLPYLQKCVLVGFPPRGGPMLRVPLTIDCSRRPDDAEPRLIIRCD